MSYLRTKRPLTAAQRRNNARQARTEQATAGDQQPLHSEQVDIASESIAGEEDPGASLDMAEDSGIELPSAERDHAPRRSEKP